MFKLSLRDRNRIAKILAHAQRINPLRLLGIRSARLAEEDARLAARSQQRRFSLGKRPVIRWIKGDGLDDELTRTAIAQATRLFGQSVDYCLCTNQLGADRVRSLLAWAEAPVEWWPLSEEDNPDLAARLIEAGCPPKQFGYWWKWFPERVRPDAPEWILDGDMIITNAPSWFADWAKGKDGCRITFDVQRRDHAGLYGDYANIVPPGIKAYSGLISLHPGQRYLPHMLDILSRQPLRMNHDGRKDMSEQGVVAATFLQAGAKEIPLHEFPMARAFEDEMDYGDNGDQGTSWGYHFPHSFIRSNAHFKKMIADGSLFSRSQPPTVVEQFTWLGGFGQWGIPGWSMSNEGAALIVDKARAFAGKRVLELGTSRGRISAMLASLGCRLTTVDAQDRGAAQNLRGFEIDVVVDDAVRFMNGTEEKFDLIVVDLHGNTETSWQQYAPALHRCLAPAGALLINNAFLWKLPPWFDETGVRWYLASLPAAWQVELHPNPAPGLAFIKSRD